MSKDITVARCRICHGWVFAILSSRLTEADADLLVELAAFVIEGYEIIHMPAGDFINLPMNCKCAEGPIPTGSDAPFEPQIDKTKN